MDTSVARAGYASGTAAAHGAGGFVLGGTAYFAAAVGIAVVHVGSPVTRGWWLVAFLSLVGGVSQLLLGPGLLALSRRRRAPAPPQRTADTELALWNVGTAMVAVADVMSLLAGVVGGGALLGLALLLFASDLRTVGKAARRPARGWVRAYAGLLGFLALSIAVGILLAYVRGR